MFAITSDGKIYENKDPVQEHFSLKANDILDICFNCTGTRLVTGSADSTARVYNVHTGACIGILTGILNI